MLNSNNNAQTHHFNHKINLDQLDKAFVKERKKKLKIEVAITAFSAAIKYTTGRRKRMEDGTFTFGSEETANPGSGQNPRSQSVE